MNRSRSLPLRALGARLVSFLALVLSLAPACETSSPRESRASAPKPALTLEERRAIFVAAWTAIEEKHFDPKLNGVDWQAVRASVAPKVDAAHDDAEFLSALQEMIRSLGESHIGIGPPLEEHEHKAHAQEGAANEGTIGLQAGWVDGKLVATRVAPGSP